MRIGCHTMSSFLRHFAGLALLSMFLLQCPVTAAAPDNYSPDFDWGSYDDATDQEKSYSYLYSHEYAEAVGFTQARSAGLPAEFGRGIIRGIKQRKLAVHTLLSQHQGIGATAYYLKTHRQLFPNPSKGFWSNLFNIAGASLIRFDRAHMWISTAIVGCYAFVIFLWAGALQQLRWPWLCLGILVSPILAASGLFVQTIARAPRQIKAAYTFITCRATGQPSPSDQQFFAQAYSELETGQLNIGLWATAVAKSSGNEAKARSMYIKYRAADLRRQSTGDTVTGGSCIE
jgi:hypothetical protein